MTILKYLLKSMIFIAPLVAIEDLLIGPDLQYTIAILVGVMFWIIWEISAIFRINVDVPLGRRFVVTPLVPLSEWQEPE